VEDNKESEENIERLAFKKKDIDQQVIGVGHTMNPELVAQTLSPAAPTIAALSTLPLPTRLQIF
jgi:hypothetical protein